MRDLATACTQICTFHFNRLDALLQGALGSCAMHTVSPKLLVIDLLYTPVELIANTMPDSRSVSASAILQ